MKIFVSTSVFLIASSMALPSFACDRHGGMFGQLSGARWTDYNPATAESDALYLEEQLSKWHEQNAAKPAVVKPAKPSFSKVSTRASVAAQARLAKKDKLAQQDDAKAVVVVKSNLRNSSQTINR